MTIAGSDSGGGAGIQADLKTFAALGVYGSSVLTAATAQNTLGVSAIVELSPAGVAAQIDAVLGDIGAQVVKTGMLANAEIVCIVAECLVTWGVTQLVVDPVMVAKSGDRLLQPDAVAALRTRLLPMALVVTPNIPEAEVLSGREIADDADAREVAIVIAALGPRYVVVKGGHRSGDPVDLVYDGRHFTELHGHRVDTRNTHGTGDTFASAIAAFLAHGMSPLDAIAAAKRFLEGALRASYSIGGGHSPVNHFHAVRLPAPPTFAGLSGGIGVATVPRLGSKR